MINYLIFLDHEVQESLDMHTGGVVDMGIDFSDIKEISERESFLLSEFFFSVIPNLSVPSIDTLTIDGARISVQEFRVFYSRMTYFYCQSIPRFVKGSKFFAYTYDSSKVL